MKIYLIYKVTKNIMDSYKLKTNGHTCITATAPKIYTLIIVGQYNLQYANMSG